MSEQTTSWQFTRSELVDIIDRTEGLDKNALMAAEARWKLLGKPLYSLNVMEEFITLLAGIQKTDNPKLDRCGVFIFCADNGVVAEGVSQTKQEVTAQVTRNFTKGLSTVNVFAKCLEADVFPIDVGVAGFTTCEGVFDAKIMPHGTNNIMTGPAMTEEEALAAIAVGLNRAQWAKEQGYDICIGGEMGIGNTTTSAAVLSCILNEDPGDLMGRESGLENVRIKNKIRVIRQALTNNRPDPGDPIDVLAKVGGLDIAALVGFYIGCAQLRMPVILDGFISLSAAVIATRLNPLVTYYLFASHAPKEPGGVFALRALEKTGYLNFGLENGDGSGGLTLLPLLRMGLSAYEELENISEDMFESSPDTLKNEVK